MLISSPPGKSAISTFSPNSKSEYKQYSRVNEVQEKKSTQKFEDDIECVSWLREINVVKNIL